MSQTTNSDLAGKIGHLEGVVSGIPKQLEAIEATLAELKREVSSLKEARSHLVGVGVGIGMAFSFIAGLLALATNGIAEKLKELF